MQYQIKHRNLSNSQPLTDEQKGQFGPKLTQWLEAVNAKVKAHYQANFSVLPIPQIIADEGIRYIRIVKSDGPGSRSAFAFIDKMTGDVLMSASWKTPAKKARGNLFDANGGTANVGVYGVYYLRGPKFG